MLNRRVIPRLDLEDGKVVGTFRYEGHLDPSDPVQHARLYQSLGADELLLWEHGGPEQGWTTRLDLVARLAAQIHIPVVLGGAINTASTARELLNAGADRVCLGEAAVERPALIAEVAGLSGRARVMVAADVKRRMGAWYIFFDHGRRPARKDALQWAEEAARQGAGEILLTTIKKDTGSRAGFDLSLAHTMANELPISSAVGGDGRTSVHFAEAFECGVQAVIGGAPLHEGVVDLPKIKALMAEREIPVRPPSIEEALDDIVVGGVTPEAPIPPTPAAPPPEAKTPKTSDADPEERAPAQEMAGEDATLILGAEQTDATVILSAEQADATVILGAEQAEAIAKATESTGATVSTAKGEIIEDALDNLWEDTVSGAAAFSDDDDGPTHADDETTISDAPAFVEKADTKKS